MRGEREGSELVNVAVLGVGRIGRMHAENLAWRVPGARLVAIADIDRGAAEECAARLGGPSAGVRVAADAGEVVADRAIDAVVIATSTDTHAPLIEECARAGKHIFCEKPIDHDLERIDGALASVEAAGVSLQIGFNRRFDPNFRYLRDRISAGAIGDLHILRITSRDPAPPPLAYVRSSGGIFLDMTIHDFDMARYLTGSEVDIVHAVGAVRVDPEIGEIGDYDTAVITLVMRNGALVTIDNSRRAIYGYDQRIEAFGSGGMLWAENQTGRRTGMADAAGLHSPRPLDFFLERYSESFVAELRDFVSAVATGSAPPLGPVDARAPVVIALAATRSARTGDTLRL
ncbi:MAG TPA: inositol 2-dehydrogenase [Kofleriaceae bacterium]|nr:inositol 2-dehydrogenase [Kofleriaceae bacterium]